MDTVEDSGMIALLPSNDDWCKIEPAHTTVVYLGKIEELDPSLKDYLIKLVSSVAILTNPFPVKIVNQEVFGGGENDRVEVFKLATTPELTSLRTIFDNWDSSEFPNFRPHATIGPEGTFVENPPLFLVFDRIMVGWGEERTTFWFRRY